jgi:hypothetical protein
MEKDSLINATSHCRLHEKSRRGHLFHPFLTFHISNPVIPMFIILQILKKEKNNISSFIFDCSMPIMTSFADLPGKFENSYIVSHSSNHNSRLHKQDKNTALS